jgi:predicted nucleotide-binding protein (sugar kinase/HSP70/actin superfamily)
MLEQIASVLNLGQKWPPVLCQRNISSVENEQVRCVSPLLTVTIGELYCERLLLVLEDILVKNQMLDEVALQARLISGTVRRLIIGY